MNATRANWWFEGTERCGYCLQVYVCNERYYCTGCDGEVCAECAVLVRQTAEVLCPRCAGDAPEPDAAGDGSPGNPPS